MKERYQFIDIHNADDSTEVASFFPWVKTKFIDKDADTPLGNKLTRIMYYNNDTHELFKITFSYGFPYLSYFIFIPDHPHEIQAYHELRDKVLQLENNIAYKITNLNQKINKDFVCIFETFPINNFIEPDNVKKYLPFLIILDDHAIIPIDMKQDIIDEMHESVKDQMLLMNILTNILDNESVASCMKFYLHPNNFNCLYEREMIFRWIKTLMKNEQFAEAINWCNLVPQILYLEYPGYKNYPSKSINKPGINNNFYFASHNVSKENQNDLRDDKKHISSPKKNNYF